MGLKADRRTTQPSIGFTTWAYALARMSAGRAGAMRYLIPPTAILISWLLLGEVPPVIAILGGLLCIAGVIVARSSGLAASGHRRAIGRRR